MKHGNVLQKAALFAMGIIVGMVLMMAIYMGVATSGKEEIVQYREAVSMDDTEVNTPMPQAMLVCPVCCKPFWLPEWYPEAVEQGRECNDCWVMDFCKDTPSDIQVCTLEHIQRLEERVSRLERK